VEDTYEGEAVTAGSGGRFEEVLQEEHGMRRRGWSSRARGQAKRYGVPVRDERPPWF
jgi:hypothetical protein